MNRDEFEKAYAERSGVTVEFLHEHGRFAIPCKCDEAICDGWQMLHTNDLNDVDMKMLGVWSDRHARAKASELVRQWKFIRAIEPSDPVAIAIGTCADTLEAVFVDG